MSGHVLQRRTEHDQLWQPFLMLNNGLDLIDFRRSGDA